VSRHQILGGLDDAAGCQRHQWKRPQAGAAVRQLAVPAYRQSEQIGDL